MNRRPTTQDITWLLDLQENNKLDLDPPYQRRSVWTPKDQRFFLDTIFRNYPSPAIFLHKTVSDEGKTKYHVVDGKQRIETIIAFVNNEIKVSPDYGDIRLEGKTWNDIVSERDLKLAFWNYQVTVEMINDIEGDLVNEVFDRLNRNSRKLTRQELRHAKFDGWLISQVEAEVSKPFWRNLNIVTTSRSKRMADDQFISELLQVLITREIHGFDQNQLDELYAKYDEPLETAESFDQENYEVKLSEYKEVLEKMQETNGVVAKYARTLAHMYTLWTVIVLNDILISPTELAERYEGFMNRIEYLRSQEDLSTFLQNEGEDYLLESKYFDGFRGATTDLSPRRQRYQALAGALLP